MGCYFYLEDEIIVVFFWDVLLVYFLDVEVLVFYLEEVIFICFLGGFVCFFGDEF